ncbi:MAG: TraB/GumN family protein [Albidovulum sp.]
MLRSFCLAALVCLAPAVGLAEGENTTCAGQDLFATIPAEERATLDAAIALAPYAQGNHWRATRGDSTINIIGTFHLFDPRMPEHLAKLTPDLLQADAVYLEATQVELDELQQAVAARPELMFTQGATLPERLSDEEWQLLSQEMSARGIPAFLASKFQPWYVSVMLAVPPCAIAAMTSGSSGMDHLISEAADALGTPTHALEPYDTVFRIFDQIPQDEQLDMIRISLPLAPDAEDMLATMANSYDREDHRAIWEYSRLKSIAAAIGSPEKAAQDFEQMEDILINQRNHDWVGKILKVAPGKRLIVAVGAGHLAGDEGVLQLLENAGYLLERAEF